MEICKLPAGEVASIWIANEHLYYRSIFDQGAVTRLTAVIQRARDDGRRAATIWQQRGPWFITTFVGGLIGFGICKLFS
jgi:hypothetical protein